MSKRLSKELMKSDNYKICLMRCCNHNKKFFEYNIDGKIKVASINKWMLDFSVRALVNSLGHINYIILKNYIDINTGKKLKRPFVFISYSDEGLIEKVPEITQEYLDLLAAYILKEKI